MDNRLGIYYLGWCKERDSKWNRENELGNTTYQKVLNRHRLRFADLTLRLKRMDEQSVLFFSTTNPRQLATGAASMGLLSCHVRKFYSEAPISTMLASGLQRNLIGSVPHPMPREINTEVPLYAKTPSMTPIIGSSSLRITLKTKLKGSLS